MPILLFGTICLLVFIATLMGGDFVSSSYKTTVHGRYDTIMVDTKLGPWLFAIMINDIKVNGGAMLWKYVDDTTISEIIPRGQLGGIQASYL